MFGLENKATPIIGVDIGTNTIKVAQFKRDKNALNLVNFGVAPTPEGCIENGKIVKGDIISEALGSLLSLHSFVGKRVSASVSGQLVTVRQITVDDIPRQPLDDIVKWEMEKHISYPIEDAVFDYQVLSRSHAGDGGIKANCLVAAAPLEIVNALVGVIRKTHLEPVFIEVEPFAELRLVDYVSYKRPDLDAKTIVMVNIGSTTTSVNVADQSVIRLTRMIPFGGARISQAIASTLGITIERAEDLKRESVNMDPQANLEAGTEAERATSAALPIIDELVLEIRRSLNYYTTRFESDRPLHLILSGGTANLKGVADYIEMSTGFTVEINRLLLDVAKYDPSMFAESYLSEMAPMFSVATGLSLREFEAAAARKRSGRKKAKPVEAGESLLTYRPGSEGL
ncbi:MAG TPA: type IV pilus assembly protein PilM [Candidatus Deferrimicrobium sp.]|nr:type IV pilus assembly protein PilM [Candidatus Deferrimicrobium sp.]